MIQCVNVAVREKENDLDIECVQQDKRVVVVISVHSGLWGIYFYNPCKVKEASIDASFLDPLPTFWKESFTCIKAPAPSSNSVYSSFFLSPSLPHPASPDTNTHEIYTAFELNGNESLGLHGMMAEIP